MMQEMRRKDRQTTAGQAWEILERGEYGVLSLCSEDGIPYGVPVSYYAEGQKIYFHCAKAGLKLRLIEQNPKVSFCVVGQTNPGYIKGDYTTEYESAIIQGKVGEVTDPHELEQKLCALCNKYAPEHAEQALDYVKKYLHVTALYRIDPDATTGKKN